jgi:hypothetical protein
MNDAFGVWESGPRRVVMKTFLHGLWDDEEQHTGVAAGAFVCIWLASDRHPVLLVCDTTFFFTL